MYNGRMAKACFSRTKRPEHRQHTTSRSGNTAAAQQQRGMLPTGPCRNGLPQGRAPSTALRPSARAPSSCTPIRLIGCRTVESPALCTAAGLGWGVARAPSLTTTHAAASSEQPLDQQQRQGAVAGDGAQVRPASLLPASRTCRAGRAARTTADRQAPHAFTQEGAAAKQQRQRQPAAGPPWWPEGSTWTAAQQETLWASTSRALLKLGKSQFQDSQAK